MGADGDNDGSVTLEFTSGKTLLSTQDHWKNTGHWLFKLSIFFTFKCSGLGLACQKILPHHALSLGKKKKNYELNEDWISSHSSEWGSGDPRQIEWQEDQRMSFNDSNLEMSVPRDLGHENKGGTGGSMYYKQRWLQLRTTVSWCDQPLIPPHSDVIRQNIFLPTGEPRSDITDPVLQACLKSHICFFLPLFLHYYFSLNKSNLGH